MAVLLSERCANCGHYSLGTCIGRYEKMPLPLFATDIVCVVFLENCLLCLHGYSTPMWVFFV
jgi:hypothetical protein